MITKLKNFWFSFITIFELIFLILRYGFKETEKRLNKELYEVRSEYVSLKLKLKELKKKEEMKKKDKE